MLKFSINAGKCSPGKMTWRLLIILWRFDHLGFSFTFDQLKVNSDINIFYAQPTFPTFLSSLEDFTRPINRHSFSYRSKRDYWTNSFQNAIYHNSTNVHKPSIERISADFVSNSKYCIILLVCVIVCPQMITDLTLP